MNVETQPDSVIALELSSTLRNQEGGQEDQDSVNKVSNWKASFMIFRSFVGIGVLTIPHSVQSFGVNGSAVLFVIFTFMFLYVLDLVLKIAVDLGYTGSRYSMFTSIEELIEKSGNGKWKTVFSIINNWMMVSIGIVSCIFSGRRFSSVMFFDWAACNFGWVQICGNKWLTHLIAFAFVLPMCLPRSLAVYSITSVAAAVIILLAGSLG